MKFKFAIVLFVTIAAGFIVCKITRDIRTGAERSLASTTSAAAAFNAKVAADRKALKDFEDVRARAAYDRQYK